jgi:hypothetical protein
MPPSDSEVDEKVKKRRRRLEDVPVVYEYQQYFEKKHRRSLMNFASVPASRKIDDRLQLGPGIQIILAFFERWHTRQVVSSKSESVKSFMAPTNSHTTPEGQGQQDESLASISSPDTQANTQVNPKANASPHAPGSSPAPATPSPLAPVGGQSPRGLFGGGPRE